MSRGQCAVCGFDLWLPVAELGASTVGMYDDGRYPGRLLVSARVHVEHLDLMPAEEFVAFMTDVQVVAGALRGWREVVRVNVAILGNQVPHVHAHVIPRRAGEPNAGRAPWDGVSARWPMKPVVREEILGELRDAFVGR